MAKTDKPQAEASNSAILTKQQAAELFGCSTRYIERPVRATARRPKQQPRNRRELINPDGLVRKLAGQYYRKVLDCKGDPLPYAPDFSDFLQEAWLGLLEAKERYNPARG